MPGAVVLIPRMAEIPMSQREEEKTVEPNQEEWMIQGERLCRLCWELIVVDDDASVPEIDLDRSAVGTMVALVAQVAYDDQRMQFVLTD
jgi:hypothetical protein